MHKHHLDTLPPTAWTPDTGAMNLRIYVVELVDIDHNHAWVCAYIAPPLGPKPCSRGHDFHNSRRELHGHYNHAFIFKQIDMGLDKKVFIKIKYIVNILSYWPNLKCYIPDPGAMNYTNLADGFVDILTMD